MRAGVLHQDLPHEPRGNSKKVRAVLPLRRTLAGQAQIGLVHQCRTLQSMIAAFLTQVVPGKPAQLVIDERHQGLQSGAISIAPAHEEAGNRTRILGIHKGTAERGRWLGVRGRISRFGNRVNEFKTRELGNLHEDSVTARDGRTNKNRVSRIEFP